jgi:predicted O-linked N-acetylglucosamine transferase (SPINDLY family)
LGIVHPESRLDELIATHRRAIEKQPDFADAYNSLGVTLSVVARHDEAIGMLRRACELQPHNATFASSLVFAAPYHPAYDAKKLLEISREWSRRHEEPLAAARPRVYLNDRSRDRPLRVGYIAPDFRPVGRFMLPLLAGHDHQRFRIYCYASAQFSDAMTSRSRTYADVWRDIATLSNEQTAELIVNDQIDILVDCSLHLSHNRLPLFALKPAPLQATFAGYPGTTGLTSIDYRISDPYLDPPGENDSCYSEKTIRLAHTFWCYDPAAMEPADRLEVGPLPAESAGVITFGCLNSFRKMNDGALKLWSKVLSAVPNSRLILLAPPGECRRPVTEIIGAGRVEFVARQERADYLQTYHRIDIGLDPIPVNGHLTSLDSLWMGVPVVTLVGRTVLGRAGWSQLNNLGLTELAGRSPQEFVEIAVQLASDIPRLSELRRTLRERMKKSRLVDGKGFAQDMEAVLAEIWRGWLSGQR